MMAVLVVPLAVPSVGLKDGAEVANNSPVDKAQV